MLMHKTFELKVLERSKDGGRILINTASVDRDRDRVLPSGVKLENYSRNPVVQWGHNYREPWATVGKTNALDVSPEGIVADFDLRPAANEQDPQNIVRLLWEGGWIRTASIGFVPLLAKPNEAGGKDFSEWELLEWSLVPIPSNQDALRLALKGLVEEGTPLLPLPHQKEPAAQQSAWVRALSVETSLGAQDLLVMFRRHTIDIPEDATVMQMDPFTGECNDVPHPDAGKTVAFKDALFAPPLEFENAWGELDGVYVLSGREALDEDMLKHEMWTVKSLSDVLASVAPAPEAVGKVVAWDSFGFGVDVLTQTGIERALKAVRIAQRRGKTLLTKRGRVLSAKNEEKIRAARDNLDEVLSQLDEQPADDEKAVVKGAIPSHETPKADPDTAWDGPGVVASLPNDREKLRLVHAWVDETGDPDAKQSYKFPHHLPDGRVVLRGVNNAKARLPQASIPDEDRAGVERHLNRHQAQFEEGKSIPPAIEASSDETDSPAPFDERELAELLTQFVQTAKEALI